MPLNQYNQIIHSAYNQIKKGNIKAIEEILKIVQQKYALTEFMLGKLNEEDLHNITEAIKWYKLASAHGHLEAHKRYLRLIQKRHIIHTIDVRV